MPGETSFTRYLQIIKDQHEQIFEALEADASHYRDPRAVQNVLPERAKPRVDLTTTRLEEFGASGMLDDLFKKSIAELTQAGILGVVLPLLNTMKERHKRLLDAAWETWENARYYNYPNDSFHHAQVAHANALNTLADFELAVKANLKGADTRPEANTQPAKPPMSDTQRAVFDLLNKLPPGQAMIGKEIIKLLGQEHKIEVDQGTLTSRIIPLLNKHYGVENRRGAGYYVAKNT